jgi:hypothetical protein
MILLATLISMAVFVVAGFVCFFVFDLKRSKGFRTLLAWVTVATVILGIFCGILNGIWKNEIRDMKTDYENIMIYNDVIFMTIDEKARFGHYEKVKAFNEQYELVERIAENHWFGKLIPKNWNKNMEPIDFYFLNETIIDEVG